MTPLRALVCVIAGLFVLGLIALTVLAVEDRPDIRRHVSAIAWWGVLTGVALAAAFVDSGNVRT